MSVSETSNMIDVLIPAVELKAEGERLAPRPGDLAGKTLALIDNTKFHASTLLDRVAELLLAKYHLAGVVRHIKPSAGYPAGDSAIAELAKKCDIAVNALGD